MEGIATTLAEVDQDVPIHSWAAVYRSASRLPGLVEFRRSWPNGAPNGVHPYHVAGSFVGYLIERFGIEKVKRWYVNSTEAHMAFGRTFRRLERDWLAWLEKRQVKPKHRDHVLAKLGLLKKKIPEAYATAKGRPLFDGKTLRGLVADNPAKWEVRDGKLVGVNPQPWTLLHSKQEFPANIGVRMRFRLVEGDAVQVRVNHTGSEANQTVMARWGTYLSLKQGGFAQAGKPDIAPGVWNEVRPHQRGRDRSHVSQRPPRDREDGGLPREAGHGRDRHRERHARNRFHRNVQAIGRQTPHARSRRAGNAMDGSRREPGSCPARPHRATRRLVRGLVARGYLAQSARCNPPEGVRVNTPTAALA